MKKMLAGLGLLAILFIGVIVNSIYLENILKNINNDINNSYYLSNEKAEAALKDCFSSWKSMEHYANIILSDGVSKKISESFFECISEPNNLILRDKLVYEINSLIEAEKLSIVSIF